MSEQMEALAKAKQGITKTKKIICIVKRIFFASVAICFATSLIFAAMQKPLNQKIASAIQSGNASFEIVTSKIQVGILQIDADFEELLARGDYALTLIILLITAGVISLIAASILHHVQKIFSSIEENETPFCKSVLALFRRVFVLACVFCFLFSELIPAFIMALVLACIYRIMEYGVALQKEIDETL